MLGAIGILAKVSLLHVNRPIQTESVGFASLMRSSLAEKLPLEFILESNNNYDNDNLFCKVLAISQ